MLGGTAANIANSVIRRQGSHHRDARVFPKPLVRGDVLHEVLRHVLRRRGPAVAVAYDVKRERTAVVAATGYVDVLDARDGVLHRIPPAHLAVLAASKRGRARAAGTPPPMTTADPGSVAPPPSRSLIDGPRVVPDNYNSLGSSADDDRDPARDGWIPAALSPSRETREAAARAVRTRSGARSRSSKERAVHVGELPPGDPGRTLARHAVLARCLGNHRRPCLCLSVGTRDVT